MWCRMQFLAAEGRKNLFFFYTVKSEKIHQKAKNIQALRPRVCCGLITLWSIWKKLKAPQANFLTNFEISTHSTPSRGGDIDASTRLVV